MQVSQDPESLLPELASQSKDFIVTGGKNGLVQVVSPVSHKDTRHHQSRPINLLLLKWDFSSTNKIMKDETTNVPSGPGPLMTNSS